MARRYSSTRRHRPSASTMWLRRLGVLVLVVVILAGALAIVQLVRGVPSPTYTSAIPTSYKISGPAPRVAWPKHAESDAEILGVGNLGQRGGDAPEAIASVTKMTTALLVVKAHPLALGENGPTLTMTPADYQIYTADKAANDSVCAIAPGEKLSEFQLLEGLLLPSGDNLATVLAQWVAGTQSAFVAKMNAYAVSLGLHHTHYGDPSGLKNTTSIPRDQMKIAVQFASNPVLAEIASLGQATLPVAGTVYNVNYAVGHDHITGLKTGSILTGNFAMSASIHVDGHTLTGIGVILGTGGVQPLITALHDGEAMANSFQTIPRSVTVLRSGQVVGYLNVPGEGKVPVTIHSTVTKFGWGGLPVSEAASVDSKIYGDKAGAKVGTLTVSVGQQLDILPLYVSRPVTHPSVTWRLTHI